jgi:hypothetical protein
MHKTNKQMGKIDSKCQYKTAIFKKWLFKINYTRYEHPLIIPPTPDVDPT